MDSSGTAPMGKNRALGCYTHIVEGDFRPPNGRGGVMSYRSVVIIAVLLCGFLEAGAQTPQLKVTLKNGTALEQRKKDQIERLGGQYDLKKWTLTREVIIEQGVQPHSAPVLTLNG